MKVLVAFMYMECYNVETETAPPGMRPVEPSPH